MSITPPPWPVQFRKKKVEPVQRGEATTVLRH